MNGTSYHYNASGQRTGKRWPNGIAATSTYDEADRLVAIAHSGQIGEVAYGLNPAGLRLTRTQSNAGQPVEIESYTYDGADQLTAVGGPRAFNATYDPVGNRTHATQGGSSTAYTANPVNQYTLAGQEPLAYDPNGNLIQMGVRWSASYDGANRLVQAQAQGNTMTVAYDAFHRPVTRTINGHTLHMVWDGWRLAEEREADTTLVALYTHGQGLDEILSRTDAQGTTLYYHHDGLGNTLALTDASGQVVERYSYDAFGKVSIFDAAFTSLPASLQNNRFLFTGREWIAELNLYDYRNRAYSAELGRFLQTDPIRFKAGDVNLYRYVSNNTINRIDPLGLLDIRYHGYYGGPGWTNGGWEEDQFPDRNPRPEDIGPGPGNDNPEPRDEEDRCYMEHDRCVARCKHDPCNKNQEELSECKQICHQELMACLKKVPMSSTNALAQEYFGTLGGADKSPKQSPPPWQARKSL